MDQIGKPLIRAYQSNDYSELKALLQQAHLFYEEMDSEDRINHANAVSPGSIIVAEYNETLIGSVIVQDQYGPMLFRLAVAQNHRGEGIGRALNNAALNRLKQKGFKQAYILVAEDKNDLQELYHSWGYRDGNLYRWMYINLTS